VLAKPQTFMNASGESVAKLRRPIRLDPHDILAVYDDLDLPVGRFRLRRRRCGGATTALPRSSRVLGKGFPRLRVGIGRPPRRRRSRRLRAWSPSRRARRRARDEVVAGRPRRGRIVAPQSASRPP
jgi:peptidyl-tRNA hydrolase